ncbi:1534_t:CDS:2 [Gigaspora rosea]|nr:1534_t:CDS:2 [Gigaspora rosea]
MYDCTLSGISTWHEFTWPETEDNTRYICARSLPGFGPLYKFSPLQLQKIIKDYVFEKPSPSSTTHTQPVKTWTAFYTSTQNKCKKEFMTQENSMNSDEDSVLINSANITDMDIDALSRRLGITEKSQS